MGILGYGCIGRECGRLAKAFGMNILGASSSGKKAPARGFTEPGTGDPNGDIPSSWYSSNNPESLKDFLEKVDILVIACPLTDTTRFIISAKTIKYLKKSAYIINIARGQVIDHDALFSALEENRIAGAILDVTDPVRSFGETRRPSRPMTIRIHANMDFQEPLPKDHRLWTAKNCVVTPHISGAGTRYETNCVDLLEVNLGRLLNGEDVLNQANLSRGY